MRNAKVYRKRILHYNYDNFENGKCYKVRIETTTTRITFRKTNSFENLTENIYKNCFFSYSLYLNTSGPFQTILSLISDWIFNPRVLKAVSTVYYFYIIAYRHIFVCLGGTISRNNYINIVFFFFQILFFGSLYIVIGTIYLIPCAIAFNRRLKNSCPVYEITE